mgnify:CR=1 FL=1
MALILQGLIVLAACAVAAPLMSAPVRIHIAGQPPVAAPIGGNFVPLPPPLRCDDFKQNNATGCVFVMSVATKLVTPLTLGNVTMPPINPNFVVPPPKTIPAAGGWFSFPTLFNWTNPSSPVVPWTGTVQYYARDAQGVTYVFQVTKEEK